MRPTVASNDQLGGALEFLLLVVEKYVIRDCAMARHRLPNMALRVKAFSVPLTDLHNIIPNYLSMFKSEHFRAGPGKFEREVSGHFQKWRRVARLMMIHAHCTLARSLHPGTRGSLPG
jgi:hypothetical protein